MFKYLDNFLNSTTMYRLVMYCLLVVAAFGVLLGFLGYLSYSGWSLFSSSVAFTIFCYFINLSFSRILNTPSTAESSVITGLILFFIFQPATDARGFFIILLVSFVAISSKYIIAWRRKHVFNPSAFAAAVFGFTSAGVSWWITDLYMLPVVSLVGLLILRKTRRFYIFFSFLLG